MSPKTAWFWITFLVGVAADQVTKWWVYANVSRRTGEIVLIPDWLSIVHSQNPGAVFGSLGGFEYRIWLFLAFTVVAIGIVVSLWWKLPARARYLPFSLGLILSGAVGNGIDRVHKQTVTDFIMVYTELPGLEEWLVANLGTNRWPSFNVADAALTVGVGLFLVHELWPGRDRDEESPEGARDPGP